VKKRAQRLRIRPKSAPGLHADVSRQVGMLSRRLNYLPLYHIETPMLEEVASFYVTVVLHYV